MTKRFPNQTSNPVERYLKWNGGEDAGYVSYWDGEQEQKVEFPFVFFPLDMLSCITGYNSQSEESIYSNEVRNTQKEVLNVRMGKQTVAQGLYQEIKDSVVAKGGKYTSSVYIAYKSDSGELHIGNIKFKGSSLGPWIDLQKSSANLSEEAVMIKEAKLDKTGSINFKYPVFGTKKVSEESNTKADDLFDEIKKYLHGRNVVEQEENEEPPQKTAENNLPERELPSVPGDDELYPEGIDDDLPF